MRWVIENKYNVDYFNYVYSEEYDSHFFEDNLVYIDFRLDDEKEKTVGYDLFYDENENLIYAEIYRDTNIYNLYFNNDELRYVRMDYGPFCDAAPYGNINIEYVKEIVNEYPVYEYVLDDIKVCFEYAYKWKDKEDADHL